MNITSEQIGNNKEKLIINIERNELLPYEDDVFNRKKNKFKIPGFRKGHLTKDLVYKFYGKNVFFEDALNDFINKNYYECIKHTEKRVLSKPITSLDKIDDNQNITYSFLYAIEPEFEIKKYKGVSISVEKPTCSDEDINNKLKEEQEKNKRLISVERPIEKGDIATIDFEGYIDNVPFNGGKGTDFPLEIGSHSFIDNFEDQLIGKKVLDDVDVNVVFPENYGEKSLAGKHALFKVKIKEVQFKELPEINDEFASEVSEFETLDEYKKEIKNNILEKKEEELLAKYKEEIIKKISDATKIDLADEAIENEIDGMIEQIENRFYYQHLSFNDYLKLTNQTEAAFREKNKNQAEYNVKSYLILQKIAKLENITTPDEKVEKYIENMANSYGLSVEKFKEKNITDNDIEIIKQRLLNDTVLDFLYENAIKENKE